MSLLVLGRVVMGDVAVTLVDLASRKFLFVEESSDGWTVRPLLASAPRHRRESLLGYERKLLEGLASLGTAPRLTELAGSLGPTLDGVRDALVKEAVHQRWLRRSRRHQLTAKGRAMVAALGLFERQIRQLKAEGGEQALTASLLPYALHYALVSRDEVPLARFAGAWVGALGDLPGWRPATHPRREFSDRGMYDPPLHAG